MKVRTIVENQDVMTKAYNMNIKSGARALQLRTALKELQKALTNLNEVRDSFIKNTGKTELTPEDAEYDDVVKRINEALDTEVAVSFSPMLKVEDIDGTAVRDIDGLIALNLLQE